MTDIEDKKPKDSIENNKNKNENKNNKENDLDTSKFDLSKLKEEIIEKKEENEVKETEKMLANEVLKNDNNKENKVETKNEQQWATTEMTPDQKKEEIIKIMKENDIVNIAEYTKEIAVLAWLSWGKVDEARIINTIQANNNIANLADQPGPRWWIFKNLWFEADKIA